MRENLRILFIEDEPLDVLLAQHLLERDGISFTSRVAASEIQLHEVLAGFDPDVVLCDYTLPGFSGMRALQTLRQVRPTVPVLMVCGSVCEDVALTCLQAGAADYLLKSNLKRLAAAVRRAISDTRQRRAYQERLLELAQFDPLTRLPTAAHVGQLVNRNIAFRPNSELLLAVVVLNLDGFRFVNEEFGRDVADQALQDTAQLLQAKSRERDSVARIGADEFLLVFADVADKLEAEARVRVLLQAISATARPVQSGELSLSGSAGIALYPSDATEFETLVHYASVAMHACKEMSPGSIQFHSGDAARLARTRRRIYKGLERAISRGELSLYYQPQFEIATGHVCGVEALARWFPPNADPISPSVFIPVAEQSGLIGSLGAWALLTACKTAAGWSATTSPPPLVCVNVSAQQICTRFTANIADSLEMTGLPAARLELEITESMLLTDTRSIQTCLAEWKALGIRIAVDDFGSGYSNMSHLAQLPIDRLKIDKSLVRDLALRSRDAAIIRTIVALGRELGFSVLAEGVETEEQFALLQELGCQQVQGYLLAVPAAATAAESLMERKWGARNAVTWIDHSANAALAGSLLS